MEELSSELRYDLISKNWVVVATGRGKRPESFKKKKGKKEKNSFCPFCKLKKEEKPVLIFNKGKKVSLDNFSGKWTTVVVPNKYPAFSPGINLDKKKEGEFYQKMNALGHHEVVVTKSHEKSLALLKVEEIKEVFDAYQERYLSLMDKPFVKHVFIFHNHGKEAGASLAHPHSQIVTTPLVDIDLGRALANARKYYYKSKGKCIYCEMNKWEKKVGKRIIFENKHFIALCPFASKSSFQVIISPKKHLAYFEKITEREKQSLAEAFKEVLRKLYKGLGDPSYNFYIHAAPSDGAEYPFYHWHWTILPKTSTWAGFELGAQMEVLTVSPEQAAEYLKKQ
jgi:UDPglucose--hexose-1-phosphate uridylyltransferase